jgi:hypothetical protein
VRQSGWGGGGAVRCSARARAGYRVAVLPPPRFNRLNYSNEWVVISKGWVALGSVKRLEGRTERVTSFSPMPDGLCFALYLLCFSIVKKAYVIKLVRLTISAALYYGEKEGLVSFFCAVSTQVCIYSICFL